MCSSAASFRVRSRVRASAKLYRPRARCCARRRVQASNRRFAAALSESQRLGGRSAVVTNCAQVKAAVRSFEISLRCSSSSPQSFALRGPHPPSDLRHLRHPPDGLGYCRTLRTPTHKATRNRLVLLAVLNIVLTVAALRGEVLDWQSAVYHCPPNNRRRRHPTAKSTKRKSPPLTTSLCFAGALFACPSPSCEMRQNKFVW